MSSEYTLKITTEQAREMPMVDLAFELLKSANTPFYYRELMAEIAKIKGLSEDNVMNVIAQLYTEINIDGRFACVGTNLWGLKRWYPVEKSDDAVGNAKRPRIINDEDDDMDEDVYAEEEDTYAEEDEYDAFGTETEEEEEAEEDTEFFEDEEIEEDLGEAGMEEGDDDSEEDEDDLDSDEDDDDDDMDDDEDDDK